MKRSVAVVVFNESKDKVLAVKRRDVPVWVLPGGGIEENETPEEAAIREVSEESGYQVVIQRKIAEYFPINRLTRHTFLFECQLVSGVPHTGAETKEIGFFPYQTLPKPFFFLHEDWLKDGLKNEKLALRKPIDQITYFKLAGYFCCHPSWVLRLAFSRLGIPLNSK